MKGLRWIPIYKKALEIHDKLERQNNHDIFYKNSLGDILYLGLKSLDMLIEDEPPESMEKLINTFREDYISNLEDNLQFMRVFGAYDIEFVDSIKKERKINNPIIKGGWDDE